MRLLAWLAIAALVGAPGWVAPAQAACRAPRHHNCFDNLSTLDFSAVPAISQRIVGEERTAEQPKKSVVEAPPITPIPGPRSASARWPMRRRSAITGRSNRTAANKPLLQIAGLSLALAQRWSNHQRQSGRCIVRLSRRLPAAPILSLAPTRWNCRRTR